MSVVPSPQHPFRRAASIVVVLALIAGVVAAASGRAEAVTTPQSTLTADWLASKVAADGSVSVPGETFSTTTQSMYVALGLAAAGQHRDALERTMTWISTHVDDWVVNDGSGSTVAPIGTDLPGRLGLLVMLAHAVGRDTHAFGTPSTDLVARLQATFGIGGVTGVYGWPDPYSAVQDQAFAMLGLVATRATVPSSATQWMLDQQCPAGGAAGTAGGWMSLRALTGGLLDACTSPDPINYTGADTNSTALAIQALVAVGSNSATSAALTFLHGAQRESAPNAGGFPWFTGGDADPNSTALVVQALVVTGQDPAGASWLLGGGTPFGVMPAWQLTGADAGALDAPWQAGVPSLLSTYQGLWGLTKVAFPFPVLDPWPPPSSTTSTSVTTDPSPAVPNFTG